MNQQIFVKALKIITIKDFVETTLGIQDGYVFYNINRNNFKGNFLYCFQLDNGKEKWEIRRRLIDFINLIKKLASKKGYNIPTFLGTQSDYHDQQILHRLEFYIKNWLKDFRIQEEVYVFIEESGHCYQGVQKYKQVQMYKKPGGRFSECFPFITSNLGSWRNRYFIIHDQGLLYKDQDNIPRQYIIFDSEFKIKYGKQSTGNDFGITIISKQRQLKLMTNNIFKYVEFIYNVKRGFKNSQYTSMQRYKSYAPIRSNCQVNFFVDGSEYFYQLAHQLLRANKQIYITGWWISPEYYLIRPVNQQNSRYRLDRILKQVADRGVSVKILIYHEPPVLPLKSAYTKQALQKLSPNIKVHRHPAKLLQLLWSHHQKMVIIDKNIGFLGGLDICYGRYDTWEHNLFGSNNMYPGIHYNNTRQQDFQKVQQYDRQHYSRDKPRLPWHDIHLRAKGPIVLDMLRHFTQYWNYASYQLQKNERQIIVQENGIFRKNFNKLNNNVKSFFNKKFRNKTIDTYSNASTKIGSQTDRVQGNMNIIKPSYKEYQDFLNREHIKNLHNMNRGACYSTNSFDNTQDNSWGFQCQMTRSAGQWSLGFSSSSVESSIHTAYIELITNSKNFIYIQNQFFISSSADFSSVKNEIVYALALRILRAYQNQQKFKVIIMLPLLPGFAGQVDDPDAKILRLQMHWQYLTIGRGKTSLFSLLSSSIPNPNQYIKFMGCRAHGQWSYNNEPVTQIIYIHSKLMIVDDQYVICGSANINDRSMTGGRDSQLCMVCKDTQITHYQIGNRIVKASKTIRDFRRKLFFQHFGLSSDQQINPSQDITWNLINSIVRENTQFYRKVFACYPDDNVHSFKQLQEFKNTKDLNLYHHLKHKVKGHAVQFPLNFLLNQDLSLKTMSKESILPTQFAT